MRRGRGRHGPKESRHVSIFYTSRLSEHYMLQTGIQYRVNSKLQFGFKVVYQYKKDNCNKAKLVLKLSYTHGYNGKATQLHG